MVPRPPRRSYRVRSVIVTPPSPSWAEYVLPMVLYCLYVRCALLVRVPESPSSTMQLFGYGCITVGPDPSLLPLIQPSDAPIVKRRRSQRRRGPRLTSLSARNWRRKRSARGRPPWRRSDAPICQVAPVTATGRSPSTEESAKATL